MILMTHKAFGFVIFFFLCLLPVILIGQRFDIEFQQCYGGSGGESGENIFMLSDSSFIIFGSTSSNDGSVSYNHGGSDFWLLKTDNDGALLWEKTFGGGDTDSHENMKITSEGDYVLFGHTFSNNGDVSGNHGGADYWVMKSDSQGNMIWQRCLGSSVNDLAGQMKLDDEDNIYVIGESHGADGDITVPCNLYDFWIAKLSSDGELLWDRTLGGSNFEAGVCILPTSDGGCIAGGYTSSNDGDVSCTNPTIMHSDAWIVKLDSNNNIEWDNCYGGSFDETTLDIIATEDDGYIFVGATNSNDGDVQGFHGVPGEEYDTWVWKTDGWGNLEWQRCLGGSLDEGRGEITFAGNGEYIINGFTDSNDGDVSGNHSNPGYADVWILKIDSEGELLWQQCFGSSGGGSASGLCILNDIELMVVSGAGESDGSVDCDLYPGIMNFADLWLCKLIDTLSVYSEEHKIDDLTITLYPNPAHDVMFYHIYPQSNNLTLTIYDIYGQFIDEFVLKENETQIELEITDYHAGVYVAVLHNEKQIISKEKFVVR